MFNNSDVTGLAWTQQKPEPDYFLQTETRTPICDETKCKNPTKTRTRLSKPEPAPSPNPTVV